MRFSSSTVCLSKYRVLRISPKFCKPQAFKRKYVREGKKKSLFVSRNFWVSAKPRFTGSAQQYVYTSRGGFLHGKAPVLQAQLLLVAHPPLRHCSLQRSPDPLRVLLTEKYFAQIKKKMFMNTISHYTCAPLDSSL